MRLLQCFSSRPISTGMSSSHHLVDPSAPSAALLEPHRHDDSSFASLSSPRICAPSNRQPLSEPTASTNPQVPASCSAASAAPVAPASKFVPTSIPDLHPEYAHAEPYCFVARTESARIVVDRMRGARGQPAMDHAHILRQQGVKVVRGPSYPAARALELMNSQPSPSPSDAQGATIVDKENERNENKDILNQHQQNRQGDDGDELPKPDTSSVNMKQKDVNARKKKNKDKASSVRRPSVPLRVEVPTSLGNDGGHSSGEDDGNGDRNIVEANEVPTPVTSPSHKSRKSLIDLRRKSNKSISKKHASGTSRRRGTLTSNSKTERVEILSEHVELNTHDGDRPLNNQQVDTSVPLNEPVNTLDGADNIRPPPTPMEHRSLSSFDKLIEKHMDNTPSELLAPIVVPRTSVVHDSKHGLSAVSPRKNKHNSKVPTHSETSSQRYADAETDMDMEFYSGLLSTAGIGQSSANTATSKPVFQLPATDVELATGENSIGSLAAMAETAASPSHALRERRKSKPLLTAVSVPSLDGGGAAAAAHNNSRSLTSFSTPPRPSLTSANNGLSSPLKSSLNSKSNTKSSMLMPPSNPLDKSSAASAAPTLYDGWDMDMSITGDRAEAVSQQHKYKQSPKRTIAPQSSALSSGNANNNNASENNKCHVNPIDIPRAVAMPPAIGQRPSANRNRKTVSFHDAAPVIIEPNLRAPSRSLPRPTKDEGGSGLGGRTLDSRGRNGSGAGNAPPTIGSVLSKARDSVTGKNMPMMIPLIDVDDSEDEEDEDESRDGESTSDSNTIDIDLRRSQAMPDRDRRMSRTLQQYMDSGSASDPVDVTHISFNARAKRNSKTTITSPNKSNSNNNNNMRHQSPTSNSRNGSIAETNVAVPNHTPERQTTSTKTSPQSPSSSSSSLYTDALSSAMMSNWNANANTDHQRINNKNQTYNNNAARKPQDAATGGGMPHRGRTATRGTATTMTPAPRSTPQYATDGSGSDSVDVTNLSTLSASGRKSLGSGMPDRERTSRSTSLFLSVGYTDGSTSDSVDMTMSNKATSLSDQRQQPSHQRRNATTSTSMTGTTSSRAAAGTISARAGGVQHPMRERERSDVSNRSLDNSSSMDDLSSSWNRNRSSRRVSSRDKAAIREATKRQSIAVAQAMSEQIRGVPRSAMLAYSQNEVIIEDDEVADDEATMTTEDGGWSEPGSMGDMSSASGANSSFTNNLRSSYSAERRMSRASKVIHVPTFKPGEVPTPPPPPPFLPRRMNVRSVRMPPPPPTAHLFANK